MIVNIYLENGKFLGSRVDESLSHLLGDSLNYNDKRYVIYKIETREHIDYQTIIKVNYLVETNPSDI